MLNVVKTEVFYFGCADETSYHITGLDRRAAVGRGFQNL
jgi:hypothetical protein